MSVYQTDEEQVEALKKWWKENGFSVVGGIVLGFAVIGGWQGWQKYQVSQGEAASGSFERLQAGATAGNVASTLEQGKQLLGEYSGSAYASLGAMNMAKLAYLAGEKTTARQHLQWAVDNAVDPALAALARVRLAHLLIDLQDLDGAASLIAQAEGDAYAAEFAELEGDLARLRGQRDEARAAYERAIEAGSGNAELVRMKLTDLGGDGSAS